ncbi:MAG TPA: hypothetical protein VOA64_03400 [Candidatus Dormibacteraeota bacterium]|nr:hypothetical protein [Candidatus Dormibacteraeota bacterium]
MRSTQRIAGLLLAMLASATAEFAQAPGSSIDSLWNLTTLHDYSQKRVSSYDRSGANADFRPISPGETLTLFDKSGPGAITHIWLTLA